MVRDGKWAVPPGKPMFRLAGSTLGLVGFGNIAREVAVRASAFGMRVLYADPFVKDGQFKEPGTKMELASMLAESDFVSVHPPLTPQTRKMMNDDAFPKMKPSAYLINRITSYNVCYTKLLRISQGDGGELAEWLRRLFERR